MTDPLQPVLILLTTAVLAVVVFRSLRLPPMLGYLLAGVIIGPHALGLIADDAETRHLAEFGVVFLMFSIGLEFSLLKLIAMKRLVFGFGTLQVFCSILIVMGVTWFIDLNWSIGFVLGGALAMSSTAIVIKLLAERLELNSEHGRQIIGVLLFQDLMVIPLLIIVPALGSGFDFESETDDLIITLAKIVVVLVIILFLGQS